MKGFDERVVSFFKYRLHLVKCYDVLTHIHTRIEWIYDH